ncbi:MAG: hypothetical protein L0Z62_18355, partial [Gemmataceae bacterium]|nr:hypothetical protein [Gemmataceae bacterium]
MLGLEPDDVVPRECGYRMPEGFSIPDFTMRSPRHRNVTERQTRQVQDLVPVKGVEVRVLSSA